MAFFVIVAAWLFAWGAGCANRAHDYLATEASFVRAGVDRDTEEREVQRVLAQRRLDVTSEVRAHDFLALGAASPGGKRTAVRVITGRGVVLAEDGDDDDLFAPGHVRLIEGFLPGLGELSLVGLVRTARSADTGCVTLYRVLSDGSIVEVLLDVSALGERACVASVAHAGHGRIAAEVGFPSWSAGQAPRVRVELGFQAIALGRPDPRLRVARLLSNSESLEAERRRLNDLSCAGADFAGRHALGAARAALAHVVGESHDRALSAYRQCVGALPVGPVEAEFLADSIGYISRGFTDAAAPPAPAEPTEPTEMAPDDALVVEPPLEQ